MRFWIGVVALSVCFCPVARLQAFPPFIAAKMMSRPITVDQIGQIYELTNAIIEGADGISVKDFEVGEPKVKLSVLVVEPRHYGFEIKEKIGFNKGQYYFNLSINASGGDLPESIAKKLEAAKPDKDGKKSVSYSKEEYIMLLKHQARVGSQGASPTETGTVFLLPGYGVVKEALLPLALKLADHGIRSVIPDFRSQGKSGGKSVTWGKYEPGDMNQLLTELQRQNIVKSESVAVVGISFGAAVAALWTSGDARVSACCLVAPFKQADKTIVSAVDHYKANFKLPFALKPEMLQQATVLVAKKLQTNWEDISPARAIPAIQCPLLFCSSDKDEIIPQKEVEELFSAAPEGAKIHIFKGVPHELLGINYSGVETVVLNWFQEVKFLSK